MEGWIKLHRKLKDHFVYKDSEMLHIWMNILLSASHKHHEIFINGKVVELYPGQVIFGRKEWSKTLRISEMKLRTKVDTLVKADMISKFSTNKYSILTVKNWSEYQNLFEKSNHQNNQKHNQQNNQDKELENTEIEDIDNQQNNHTDNQEITTNKNEKNDKNNIYSVFEFWNEKGVIKHRKLTSKMSTKIKAALKDYSLEEIQQAISNYAEITLSEKYYFKHRWTIDEFLSRGLSKFENREVSIQNYIREKLDTPKTNKSDNWRDTGRRF